MMICFGFSGSLRSGWQVKVIFVASRLIAGTVRYARLPILTDGLDRVTVGNGAGDGPGVMPGMMRPSPRRRGPARRMLRALPVTSAGSARGQHLLSY
eukprot:455844-Hanusia_phi.AAC.1